MGDTRNNKMPARTSRWESAPSVLQSRKQPNEAAPAPCDFAKNVVIDTVPARRSSRFDTPTAMASVPAAASDATAAPEPAAQSTMQENQNPEGASFSARHQTTLK